MRLKTISPATVFGRPIWLLLALAILLAGCGREPLVQTRSYVFGTLVDVSIFGESEARAQELTSHVLREFQHLHDSLHAWQPSELSRLNDAFASSQPADVTPELSDIIADATKISEQSGGLFNPAIGGLIKLWGFQNDEFVPHQPDPMQIRALLESAPHMSDIVIDSLHARSRNIDGGGPRAGIAEGVRT